MTLHKNCVSRKNTILEAKSIPMPMQKIIVHTIANGSNKTAGVIVVPVRKITIKSGMSEREKLMKDDITLEIGKIYLGIYTFVIKEALLTMEFSAIPTASAKKLKNTIPVNR